MSNEQTLPITINLTGEDAIVQGANWRCEFLLSYATSIWDTAGYTGAMDIRAYKGGPSLLSTPMTTANGQIEVGIQGTAPNQRNIAITLTAAATNAMTFTDLAFYDLKLTDTSGVVTRVYEGHVAMNTKVTN